MPYLEDDDGDDGHLGTEPRKEPLQLAALTDQVTVHYDGNQAHPLHRRLRRRQQAVWSFLNLNQGGISAFSPNRSRGSVSDLPLADALHPDAEGPLQAGAELKGIAADLNDIVNERAQGSQREG